MGTLRHPLVEDRMIQGEGTQKSQWLQAFENSRCHHSILSNFVPKGW